MRSWYELGRAHRRLGHEANAKQNLTSALCAAEELGNEYFKGLIWLNRAQLLQEESPALAMEAAANAVGLLERVEGRRYFGLCLTFYGSILCDFGRIDEALPKCVRAEQIA